MKRPLTLSIALTLAGCASAPPPAPPPEAHQLVRQDKALAAQHWGAIAADVAARTKSTLASRDFLDGRAFYVAPSSQAAFDQAFTNFMITALVQAGLPVTTQQEGAVEIKYETQVIEHRVEFDPRKQGYVPGAPENVAASFWVMRNAPESVTASSPTAEPPGKAHMWPTSAEMVVTTSVVDADQYLQRTTDAYYIEGADIELFRSKNIERNVREWGVVSQ